MSSKKLTTDARRSDLWYLNPYDVVLKEQLRGRHTPPSDDDIIKMAISIHENGQLQPVEVRRDGEQIVLVHGFTRAAAGRLLRDGFTVDGVEHKDAEFMLKCCLVTANDKEAFIHNVVENAHRNQTTAIDDAHNQRKLRESYGYSDADIAKLYQESTATVGNKRKLLLHDDATQSLVHEGRLGVSVAISLLELPEGERQIAIKQAVLSDGRISGETVRKQVRAHHLRDEGTHTPSANGDGVDEPKYTKRSFREIRTFFDTIRGDEKAELPEALQEFCKKIVAFYDGKISEKSMTNAMLKLIEKE